ncbi:dnaJ [Symbiodinium necroappetens]|uniref:DnaJ protein n=1 Tax=Symbiodinium necroappetens TaxID=1628268 RepID=A0A812XGI4_9DINO|nr:dnaJ [Symbiodinium necroappetens]
MERPCDASPAGPWLRPMRKLLEARADPNAADLSGEPPLIEAACYGDLEVCQLLLEGRADAAHESTVGVTALSLAECEGHREVAELLTQHLQSLQSMAKEDSASKAAEVIAQAAAANQLKKEDLCQSEDEQNVDQHVPSSPSARPSEAAAATDRSEPLTVSPPAELGSAEAGPDCREAAEDQLKKEDLCQSEDEQNVDQHVPSSPSARPSEAAAAADRSEPLTVSESTDLVPAEAGPVLKKEVPRGRPPQVQQDRSMPSQTRSGNTSFTPTLASSPVIKSASSAYSSAQSTQKSTDPATTRYTGAQPTRLPSRPNTATKTHEPFFVNSRYTSTSKPHAKAKTQAQSQAKRRPPTPESSDGEDQENIGPRIRKAMEPFPSYSGEMPPPEAESTWSDQELYNYFFSSGFIKPKKKASKPKPTPQQMEQYFRTLNLRPGAKAAAVKKAYRQLALRFHPDKNQDSTEAKLKFQEITEAYAEVCRVLDGKGLNEQKGSAGLLHHLRESFECTLWFRLVEEGYGSETS